VSQQRLLNQNIPGLRLRRAEARVGEINDEALRWEQQGLYAVPPSPCGDCKHWRYRAGQELFAQVSVKLDLSDMGWGKFLTLKEMGLCALQSDKLAHRFSTCERHEPAPSQGKGDRRR
jgi:hypothetical protein